MLHLFWKVIFDLSFHALFYSNLIGKKNFSTRTAYSDNILLTFPNPKFNTHGSLRT